MIVITTPIGQIGHQILDSGKPIRIIARDPSRLDKIRDLVEVVQGSHDDIDVLTKAFTGADCVFWLVPPNPNTDSPTDHYLSFTRPACEAIKSQGVKRVVTVTSLGHEFGQNAGLLTAAFAMDDLIESTGVSYRALRMPFFLENLLNQVESIKGQGVFFMPNSSDRQLATVATTDIAETAAKLLLDNSWSGQDSIPVVGPDKLSPNEMVQIMSEVLARPVHFQQVSSEAYKATMMQHGMSEAWAQGMVDMAAAQNHGIYDADPGTSRPTTPTSFRQWCEDILKPAVLN
ncbi:MAG: NAD(P)H-binding protein [Chroococcidiopsidaceae cyanobacterium CP_BM_RX_35]|nr:NAD(P)H-binding protein [Chroococcidiopsidaceae cyanobacterium CP_BM_RX_35]